MAARRTRIDSAVAAVATMAAAARELEPLSYIKLTKQDLPFWDAVIAERAKSEWSDADLIIAALLARAMASAQRVTAIKSADQLARRIVTLRRALGIDSRSKHGEQRDVEKRRAIAKDIESGLDVIGNGDDDLLAGAPTIQ